MDLFKIRIRKKIAIILTVLIAFSAFAGNSNLVMAKTMYEEDLIYDGGFDCTYQDEDLICISKNGDIVLEMSYENGYRKTKNGLYNSEFTYEDGILLQEIREDITIEYLYTYDEILCFERCTEIVVAGETYGFIWDSDGIISGMTDSNGNEIVKYVYNFDTNDIQVLQEINGKWMENLDDNFIGNYNKYRFTGSYYDEETGWYYGNGIYSDVAAEKVVGLKVDDSIITNQNPYLSNNINEGIALCGYEEDDWAALEWMEELVNNSTFNAYKQSGWYAEDSASTVGIIARMIYGESTSIEGDQRAVAWVVLNRCGSNLNIQNIRNIVANPDNFNGVNSSTGRDAKVSTDQGWRNAVYLACLMCTNCSLDCWNFISPKPYGFSNQIYFRSKAKLPSNPVVSDINSAASGYFYDCNNKMYYKYPNGTIVQIYNLYLGGEKTYSSVTELKAKMDSYSTDAQKNRNIFFSAY